jgi:predicted TIM-barrel fold metal-dependent hydrolase
MATIDADAHVHETLRTWEYMAGADKAHQPKVVKLPDARGVELDWWVIDGRLWPKQSNIGEDTDVLTREGLDIPGRLRHMDALGVDVQVIYPTVFLRPVTTKAAVEGALCRSYNRWLADIWAEGKGRLRWAAVLPLLDMESALAELRWAREHGACAAFIRGLEGDRRLSDPYFFPLYETAMDLDIPVGIHSATGAAVVHDYFGEEEPGFCKFKLAVVGAVHSLLFHQIPQRFPRLRWGVIEVSSQWVPYLLHDLAKRFQRRGQELGTDVLRRNRVYVGCQVDDDLPYVLSYSGPDNIVIGSDYGHADTSSELEALRLLKEQGDVDPATVDKILDANARALYAL